MRKISLTICLALAFLVPAAVAQAASGQTTPGSSPSSDQASQQPGYPSQQQPSTAPTPDNPGMSQNNPSGQNRMEKGEKGERRLKGCVQSEGGKYALETKKGKTIALTGQDVSAHVGHEVALKGTWESGAGTAVSSGTAGGSEKTFNVASVEMISETCGAKNKGSSGKMGTSPSSTEPSSTPPPSTQPPQ